MSGSGRRVHAVRFRRFGYGCGVQVAGFRLSVRVQTIKFKLPSSGCPVQAVGLWLCDSGRWVQAVCRVQDARLRPLGYSCQVKVSRFGKSGSGRWVMAVWLARSDSTQQEANKTRSRSGRS